MSKGKLKQKLSPISSKMKGQRCRFCQTSLTAGAIDLISIQLEKKYLLADIEASHCCKFQSFVLGKTKSFAGGIAQFKRHFEEVQTLDKYFCLNQIKEKITQTIRLHVKNDHNKPIHFEGKFLFILLKNYQKHQNMYRRKNKSLKSSKDCGRSTSVGDLVPKTPARPKFQVLKGLKSTNESLLELKKLTKNVGKMCHNFTNKALLANLEKEFQRKTAKSKEKQRKKIKNLDKKIEEKISVIKEKSTNEHKYPLIVGNEVYRYGVKKQKSKSQKKYHHKRVASEVIGQSIKNDKESPLTPAYIPPSQYFCGQNITRALFYERKSRSIQKANKKARSEAKSENKKKKAPGAVPNYY